MDSIRARIPPSDTTNVARRIISYYQRYSGTLRSEWFMAAGRVQEAVAARPKDYPDDLASAPIFGWGSGVIPGVREVLPHQIFVPFMVDVVPRAYLALGQLDSAIAAYERAISHEAAPYCPVFPRYHYRLAQVDERKGLKGKAIAEYERFLKIWGKADPIYKEPADARARLAKLKRIG